MKDILVPVSPGEMLDKITILRIKAARMSDAAKVANVKHELALLEQTWKDSGAAAVDLGDEEAHLTRVNEALWVIEDDIRDEERAGRRALVTRAVRLAGRLDPEIRIDKRIRCRSGSWGSECAARRVAPLIVGRGPETVPARIDYEMLSTDLGGNRLAIGYAVRSVLEIRHVENEAVGRCNVRAASAAARAAPATRCRR